MKNIYKLTLLPTIIIIISVQWLCGQSATIDLNKPATGNQLQEATQKITLSAGFTYDAQNVNTFIAKVIPANGQGFAFTEPIDNTTLPVEQTNPVGIIEGNWSVSSTGGAQYSIPVKLPRGIGNMVPSLSVVYNSQSGEGLLGKGWNISGLSGITRVASDIYHENFVDFIHFNTDDHFALDGQRLIPVTLSPGSTGVQEYRTEIESFSRITAYGSIGDPTYFILESKDGKTIEYGRTPDSRIRGIDAGFVWNVNKISDKNGNYITETYHNDSEHGEYHLLTINYTGTASDATFNSIEFEYQPRIVPIESYVSRHKMTINSLMKNINVKNGSTVVSQFHFNYNTAESKLTEVVEYGKNGSRINSTNVDWGIRSNVLTEPIINPNQVKDRYFGDFNGDGKTDYVLVDGSTFTLFLANGHGDFYEESSDEMPENFNKVYPGDFNGDGKKDLLVLRLLSGIYYPSLLISDGSSFTRTDMDPYVYYLSPNILIGTFTGNGKDDILEYNSTTGGGQNYQIGEFRFDEAKITYLGIDGDHINWGTKAYSGSFDVPLDINGDGKTDIMVIDTSGSRFYELKYDDGYHLKPICIDGRRICIGEITNFNSSYKFLFGDFNGDGLTDIATYDTHTNWNIYISNGGEEGYFNQIGSISFAGFYTDHTINNFYAQDMDGDGKCDLVCVGRGKSTTDPVKIYVSYSGGDRFCFNHLPTIYTPQVALNIQQNNPDTEGDFNHFDDFDGDGTCDFYYDDGSMARMYTTNQGLNQNFVSQITNGYNSYLQFTYKPLTDYTVYWKNMGLPNTYPLMDFQGPMYVVSSVLSQLSSYCQSCASDVTNYVYTGAVIHQQGKGFLGFQEVMSTNLLHNIHTHDFYEFNPTYFNGSLSSRSTYLANRTNLISSSVYTNSLIDFSLNGNKRIFPYVSTIVDNNYLSNTTKTTTYSINNDGNPTSIAETYDDGSYNTTTYPDDPGYSSEGSWMPAKPLKVTITKKHYLDAQPFNLSTSYTYQPVTGLVLSNTTGALTTSYKYFDNGNLKQVTQSDGTTHRVNHFEYEPKGRFVWKSYDALDHLTVRTYDDATGNVLTETAPNNQITRYTYDDFGRLSRTTYPTTQSVDVSYHWAGVGRPATAIYYKLTESYGTSSVSEYYDGYGRPLRTVKTGFLGQDIYSSTIYNDKGQVARSSLPFYDGQQALAKTYTYDVYGRQIFDEGPSGCAAYTYIGRRLNTVTGLGRNSAKIVDAQGLVLLSNDEGGTISYLYKSVGKPSEITTNGTAVSIGYDSYGRQISLTDPDAGVTSYGYNGYNELISQIDPKNTTSILYGVLGNDSIRTDNGGTTSYSYYLDGNPGLLSYVTYPGGTDYYSYDTYGRLTDISKTFTDGTFFTYPTGYNYDKQGRITSISYPSGFTITNVYNNYGYLSEVWRADNNTLIWQGQNANAFDQFTQFQHGNGFTTTKNYTNIGFLTNTQTGSAQNLNYNFDPMTGNLLSRSDVTWGLTENFTYDNSNRLCTVAGPEPLTVTYGNNGNIASKTGIGDYSYDDLPHAVSKVTNPQNFVSTVTQNVNYTPFNKVGNISEGAASLQYTYDGYRQRTIAKFYQNGVLHKTTHYIGSYEKEIFGSSPRQLHYISGGDGLAAIYVVNGGLDTMYYIHTDALGSINTVSIQAGYSVQHCSFDAWGRSRNPSNWSYSNLNYRTLFSRGYTGHEHLDDFNLINMNGRVYDPMLGRFLSPDIMVQNSGNPQSYNRYSYCLNNPFAYTDPSGYSWLSKIGDGINNALGWLAREEDRFYSWEKENHITTSANYSHDFNLGGQSTVSVSVIPGSGISYNTVTPKLDYPDVNFDPGAQTFNLNSGKYSFNGGSSVTSAQSPISFGFSGKSESQWGPINPSPITKSLPNEGFWNDFSGLRMPDYYSMNISIAIPNPYTATLVGWNGTVSYGGGNFNVSYLGVAVGKSATVISISATANWLLQSDKPSSNVINNFTSASSVNVGGGFILGGGITQSLNDGSLSWGVGLYTPQVGFSINK